jgi:hypothetical protein
MKIKKPLRARGLVHNRKNRKVMRLYHWKSGAFLVIVPKGINQLGLDERKRVYRISGGILAVERAQKEI